MTFLCEGHGREASKSILTHVVVDCQSAEVSDMRRAVGIGVGATDVGDYGEAEVEGVFHSGTDPDQISCAS
jgi:hypothetical protein